MNEPIIILTNLRDTVRPLGVLAVWVEGLRLDRFRQTLFSVRGDLFEMVMKGDSGLTFTDPNYIRLRRFLNGRIRFAHRVSFSQIVVGCLMSIIPGTGIRQAMKKYKTPAQLVIESLEEGTLKTKLGVMENRASKAMVQYLVMTSPSFLVILIAIFFGGLLCVLVTLQFKAINSTVRAFVVKEVSPSVRAIDYQVEALDAELGSQVLALAA